MASIEIGKFEQGLCITKEMEEAWKDLKKALPVRGSLTRIYGIPNVGDSVLFTYSNKVNPLPGSFRSERVMYPPNEANSTSSQITGIAVIDFSGQNQGGETKFVRGEIPGDYAEVEVSSQFCAGYSVKVIFVGHN